MVYFYSAAWYAFPPLFTGLLDTWEYNYFGALAYSANDDPDYDWLNNTLELIYGLHPGRRSLDIERDGLPDSWKKRHFGSPAAVKSSAPLIGYSGKTVLDGYELGIALPHFSTGCKIFNVFK